ncbi:60S ribosomal protein L22 [Conglomerata obtusa]
MSETAFQRKFTFDCSTLTNDNLVSISEFEEYVTSRIKINGKVNNTQGKCDISTTNDKLIVDTKVSFKKHYLKFLAKKFLHSKNLKDWVRIVSTDKDGYQFVYFNVENEDEE